MRNLKLLVDFGSTFTKVLVVDLDSVDVIARTQVPSTVEEDVTIGLREALRIIRDTVDISDSQVKEGLACSSAAGGLGMVSIGFVPELSSEAARRAALGVGAKIVGHYSYELSHKELSEIEELSPDIILLCGGTDGGDKKVVTHNAKVLAGSKTLKSAILVAANKTAQDDLKEIFQRGGKRHVRFTENVMPDIGLFNPAPCGTEIREIFLGNVIEAKGIAKARTILKDIVMPTPTAVLTAAKLLSEDTSDNGWGELMVIDVGGATTDVHSIAKGSPTGGAIAVEMLPEPYVKRTVEGDLGVRHNIDVLIELGKARGISPDNDLDEAIERFSAVEALPQNKRESYLDMMLASIAVDIATERHAGRLEIVYSASGKILVQHGKNLTNVRCVVGTGGPTVFSSEPKRILERSLFSEEKPNVLKPKEPRLYIDEKYILYAAGLLAQVDSSKALRLMKKYLKEL